MSAAPSMAAAIAASLPAPQSAPTPAAPSYEAIPASMSKVIDLESDIPLQCVQLDGMVSAEITIHLSVPSPRDASRVLLHLSMRTKLAIGFAKDLRCSVLLTLGRFQNN